MNLGMIQERLKIITDIKEEVNRIKALYDEALEDNSDQQELEEFAKEFKEKVKELKGKVEESKTLKAMKDEIKDMRADLKDNKDLLAQELADYYKDSGQLDFEDAEGNKKRIIFSAKVVDYKS